uniref:Uncharacterized protein n=1 Tax=Tanacetum cinerariifolium TaxID=118510 RepID=A0A6L2N3Z1_TANCI|nr:hypothetical protein [Tanacetum cinerariifolium]
MKESKKCSGSSKGQKLEAVRVLWYADYNIHYNTIDLAGREEIPLTRFTREQMLNNVRLEVEEESGVSLELPRSPYVAYADSKHTHDVAYASLHTYSTTIRGLTSVDLNNDVAPAPHPPMKCTKIKPPCTPQQRYCPPPCSSPPRKENREMLIDSIKNGLFKLKAEITIPGVDGAADKKRAHTVADLSPAEKLRYDYDIKAILLGFTSEPGELIHSHYCRSTKLINDMKIIKMSMTPIQVNTKFVNHVQLEWSRFVVPSFLPTDEPIANLKKAMVFLNIAMNSKFLPTNNQLRTSSNQRTQATFQDGYGYCKIIRKPDKNEHENGKKIKRFKKKSRWRAKIRAANGAF